MDICADFPERFFDVSAEIVIIDLSVQKNAFRIDDKGPPQGKTRMFIVNAEYPGKVSRRVGAHGVSHVFEHFFIPLPREMHEFGVGADRNYFSSCFFEGFILLCQSSKFGGSDEGKIGGIKEKDGPLLCRLLRGQRYLGEIAFGRIEGFKFEIWYGLAYSEGTTVFRHGDTS